MWLRHPAAGLSLPGSLFASGGRRAPISERSSMGQLNAGIVPVTPFQQNCTILFDMDDKTGVVVDPGGDVDQILAVLKDNGIKVDGDLADAWPYRPCRRRHGAEGGARRRDHRPARGRQAAARQYREPGETFRRRRCGAQLRARPFPQRGRDRLVRRARRSRCCIARATRRAMSSTTTAPRSSPMSATCCSAARSGAPTCRAATMPR